jgi:PKD repeat protein
MQKLLVVALVLAIALLGACSRAAGPVGPDPGANTFALDYDLVVNPGSSVDAADVDGRGMSVADALSARTTSALPSGYVGIQGMHFTPHTPPGSGFSGRLTVAITAGSPPIDEFEGVLLYLYYIDATTLATSLVDSSRCGAANRVAFDLNCLGYFVIAENTAVPRPGEGFWISAYADMSLAQAGTTINFHAIPHNGADPVTFVWDMGDGTQLNGNNVTHAFTTAGQYDVSVVGTDADGDLAPAASTPIVISALPVTLTGVDVTAEAITDDQQGFTFSASVQGGYPPFSYAWDFDGDGSSESSAEPPFEYHYDLPGVYHGSLEVTDDSGASVSSDFTCDARLVQASASTETGEVPLVVSFTLTVAGLQGGDVAVLDFGDGQPAFEASASDTVLHTYYNPGDFDVVCSIRSAAGSGIPDKTGNSIALSATQRAVLQLTQPLLPTDGQLVDIYGFGFGASQGVQHLMLGATELSVTEWTPTHIRAVMDTSGGGSMADLGITGGSIDSNTLQVTLDSASQRAAIQNVVPFRCRSGYRALYIGHGFGLKQSPVTLAAQSCTVLAWSPNMILIDVPGGIPAGPATAQVSIGGIGVLSFTTELGDFTADEPALDEVLPAVHELGVDAVELSGSFGPSEGGLVLGNGLVLATDSWSNSEIQVSTLAADFIGWVVVLDRYGVSEARSLNVVTRPQLSSLDPAIAAVGESFDIVGSHFGASQLAGFQATLNGSALTINSWSDSLIKVTVPIGAVDGPVVVTTLLDSNSLPLDIVPGTPGKPGGEQF